MKGGQREHGFLGIAVPFMVSLRISLRIDIRRNPDFENHLQL